MSSTSAVLGNPICKICQKERRISFWCEIKRSKTTRVNSLPISQYLYGSGSTIMRKAIYPHQHDSRKTSKSAKEREAEAYAYTEHDVAIASVSYPASLKVQENDHHSQQQQPQQPQPRVLQHTASCNTVWSAKNEGGASISCSPFRQTGEWEG